MRGIIAAAIQRWRRLFSPVRTADADDDRATSLGLFNTADAWRLSAMALERRDVSHAHADKPIRFPYHALELYLKALLRQKYSVRTITRKYRHNLKRSARESKKLGLVLNQHDTEMFAFLDQINAVSESRYIVTGSKTLPTFEALHRTCNAVRDEVRRLLLIRVPLWSAF